MCCSTYLGWGTYQAECRQDPFFAHSRHDLLHIQNQGSYFDYEFKQKIKAIMIMEQFLIETVVTSMVEETGPQDATPENLSYP